jgi:hypothetical protein
VIGGDNHEAAPHEAEGDPRHGVGARRRAVEQDDEWQWPG